MAKDKAKSDKKESDKGGKTAKRMLWFNLPLVILIVGFVVILFVQDNNILVIRERNKEIRELKEEIARVQDTTKYYKQKIMELNTSREELERISREQYRMKKANEDVFITDIE